MSIFSLIEPAAIIDDGAFTRASTARYFDRSGIIRTAPVGDPRLNYRRPLVSVWPEPPPTGGGWLAGLSLFLPAGPPSEGDELPADPFPIEFLAEAAATNLMLQSQALGTGWTATEATVGSDAGTAPDGTETADTLIPSDVSSADHSAFKAASATVTSGAAVGASIFLKEAGYATALFRCAPAGQASGFEARVNLETGAIIDADDFGTGATLTAARVYGLPGGWWRVEIEGSITGVTTYGLAIHVGDGTAFAGDEASGILAWGWQLELGSVSSYIPTAGSAVTRAADVGTPMLVSALLETEPVWTAGTYAAGAIVRGTGSLAHTLFLSLVADNTAPLTDATKWLRVGSTNRWRLFDQAVSSKASSPEALDFIAIPSGFVDTLVLLGLSAGVARIGQIDPTDGLVFDETFSLVDDSDITDWYAYFFAEIKRKTELVVSDLQPYAGAQLAIMLSDVDATVLAGECLIGRRSEIGTTQAGASVGIQDYSRKVRDDFGNYSFVERAFSRRMRANVWVEKPMVDAAVNLLASFRATPTVYIASDVYSSTIVYGIAKDWDAVIAHPDHTIFALDLESLI